MSAKWLFILKRLPVSVVLILALIHAGDSFAIGENPGTARRPILTLLRTEGIVDVMRATVIVDSGSDGCGPYTVSLFMSRGGGESFSVGSDRGTAMAPGMNRAHSFTFRKKHWPGMRYVISGSVTWGPDAQIPVPELMFDDPPPARH